MLGRFAFVAAALAVPVTAHALKPAMHADITAKACLDAGLPKAFCTRIATENYNTDAREWDDLRAHAQIDDDETACDAADRAALRVFELGSELRGSLAEVASRVSEDAVGRAAAAVGRSLHTIQDNCAHHGMPNPQHAWYSLGDFCDGTDTSPDVQPEAVACARAETKAAMALIAAEVRRAGVATKLAGYSCPENHDSDNHQTSVCQSRFLPAPWDACEFLGEAKLWDGIDRTWTNAPVVSALRAQFAAGLGAQRARGSICGGDARVLGTPASTPIVDAAGAPSCNRVHLLCLGSADADDNPFASEPEPEDSAGCATHRGDLSVLVIALALALRRRRYFTRS